MLPRHITNGNLDHVNNDTSEHVPKTSRNYDEIALIANNGWRMWRD